ncbi:PLP-dependent aminotransferase family protein [Microbacterium trichothecenolyticum]|uniref:aminotransferase-like domain-containing protein n=1 Tax=Microbacterium trichothecenolyticum TaxID=69370 RepID=UPI001C6F394B|nr:PLP-dependent aminotransferase family protein [Microbacterium trichothecenolyticum]MBW9121907.1 PLP-dependent aminotransferase family protein [Microbacterium trichothecenolyticum]
MSTPTLLAERVTGLVAPSPFGAVLGHVADDAVHLTGGSPAPESLPRDEFAHRTVEVLADLDSAARALDYSGHQGDPALRRWIGAREGVDASRVVITNGALHGLSMTLLAAVDPGDLVFVENPVYPLAVKTLQLTGARVDAVPVDEDGLDVDALDRALRSGARPRALYVVPDFQNPTGSVLAPDRRLRLVELAERYGFLVISDNPYSELRGSGEDIPDLDPASDRIVHVNTFSKTLGPGLRLGWTVAPEWLVAGLLDLRARHDQHASSLLQAVVTRLVTRDDLFERTVAAASVLYNERAVALVDGLRAELGDGVDVALPAGGVFAWPRFTDPNLDVEALASAAAAEGVVFLPGGQFSVVGDSSAARRHARVSFGQTSSDQLRTAASRIARAYRRVIG